MYQINPIVCPISNAAHLTRKAHLTFAAQDVDPKPEILYIDNASVDSTPQMLAGWDCHVLRNHVPLSVAQSWNQGLEWWWAQGAEHVLVCNNDVELRPDTYRLLLEDGGGFVTAVGNQSAACIKALSKPVAEPRGHPDFSCFLIHKEVWDKVGPFDEKFEMAYCEDQDYHVRLHMAGVWAYCIDLPFYHIGSATVSLMSPKEQKKLQDMANRNRAYFREKWGVEGASPEYYAMFTTSPAPSDTNPS